MLFSSLIQYTSRRLFSQSRRLQVVWTEEFEEHLNRDQIAHLKTKDPKEYERLVFSSRIKAADAKQNCSVLRNSAVDRLQLEIRRHSKDDLSHDILCSTLHRIKTLQLAKRRRLLQERNDGLPENDEGLRPEDVECDAVRVVETALHNSLPLLAIREVEVAGQVYSVPTPITKRRQLFDAVRWIVNEARDRPDRRKRRLYESLAEILIQTANHEGPIINKRTEHHKICEANRAYSNYRKNKK